MQKYSGVHEGTMTMGTGTLTLTLPGNIVLLITIHAGEDEITLYLIHEI